MDENGFHTHGPSKEEEIWDIQTTSDFGYKGGDRLNNTNEHETECENTCKTELNVQDVNISYDRHYQHSNNDEPNIEDDNFTLRRLPPLCRSISQAYFPKHPQVKSCGGWKSIFLAYQTLGVVYGDLGTSPLYVFSSLQYPLSTIEDYFGVLSLIFWSLTMIPLVKYVFIVLRADDHGEGGTFALYSLLSRNLNLRRYSRKQLTRFETDAQLRFCGANKSVVIVKALKFIEQSMVAQKGLLLLVLLGTCMVIGDGVLAPAISVLSAIEGIKSKHPGLSQNAVVIISTVILICLFIMQRFGTHRVTVFFSPIMLAWFLSNATIGIYNIVAYYPEVLKAISPHYIPLFLIRHGKYGWRMLGAVILCITGAEAMFADLGHFNKRAIQIAFSAVVYPSLILTYAGQGAYLIKNPSDLRDAFYKSVPKPVFWPMFIVSTLAAIVASQALISATFSIVKQLVALDCFPRVKIIHTSERSEGEVYSPEVSYCLMLLCITVVLGFRSGARIGNAYGVAVTCVMLITTILVTLVMIMLWNLPLPISLFFLCIFGLIEGAYLTSVLNKILEGGWVPFALSSLILVIMLSWIYGRTKKYEYEVSRKVSKDELQKLCEEDMVRVPGVCIFYSDLVHGISPLLRHYVRCTGTLHQVLVFITIRHVPVPTILADERFVVDRLIYKEGVYRCVGHYGYMDLGKERGGSNILDEVIDCLKRHIGSEDDICLSCPLGRNGLLKEEEENYTNGWKEAFLRRMREDAEAEVNTLVGAGRKGVVYVLGKATLQTSASRGWFESFVINHVYHFLVTISTSALEFLNIPPSQFLQVGMTYQI